MVTWDGVSPAAMTAFNQLGELTGDRSLLNVISAYRSPEHNRKVGGAKRSQHTHGNAFDISTKGMSQAQREALVRQAYEAGFTGVGAYANSLHFDVGAPRIWGPNYRSTSAPDWLRKVYAQRTGSAAAGGAARPPSTGIEAVTGGAGSSSLVGDPQSDTLATGGTLGALSAQPPAGPRLGPTPESRVLPAGKPTDNPASLLDALLQDFGGGPRRPSGTGGGK